MAPEDTIFRKIEVCVLWLWYVTIVSALE